MKRIFSNHHEVAHVWASQSQSAGEASHMFFDGPSIYSYGRHFEIARIVRPGVVLFNPASYSNSTSKHQSRARSAVSHMKVFTVPSMTDHKENAAYLVKSLEAELFRLSRARKYVDTGLTMYQESCAEALDYVQTFRTEVGYKLYRAVQVVWARREQPFTDALKKAFEAKVKAQREKAKADRIEKEARAAARKLELQADYDNWKAGADVRLPWDAVQLFPVALRVNGGNIETTRGASVPVIEARKLWRTLRTDADKVIGMRVGHYTVDRIDPAAKALIIGCHTIPMGEIARMAVKLGLESEAA